MVKSHGHTYQLARHVPVVLDTAEVTCLLKQVSGMKSLMIQLMYGSGMRVSECVRLRILDMDFSYQQIVIREGKGKKDRGVPMPGSLIADRRITGPDQKDPGNA